MKRLRVIDSHTGGEPTRVVLEGGPDLGTGPLSERLARFASEHDAYRSAIVNEPRGSDVLVGALLVPPHTPGCVAGVLYFDNAVTLGMCGHGTIGLVTTLAHLGRIGPGRHRIDTPVGVVEVELHADGRVSVDNIPSYRVAAGLTVDVPGHGPVTGDVAWGGNCFFLAERNGMPIEAANVEALTDLAWRIRLALDAAGAPGAEGRDLDHVVLSGPSPVDGIDSRNFVLCPGKAYDRSPCGTGTSAKLACLAAEGKLAPGAVYRQESVIGSVFEASYTWDPVRPGVIRPRITGSAFVTADSTLLLDERDPFCWGLRPSR